ncbi:MAG: hypothetical protein OEM84_02305 [Acidimicrobiia bacterium]|nr:hypothetical protein [Acidimicrobiia bacterium]
MRNEKLKYQDDLVAQQLFELAGTALADPGDAEPRREFWKFVDTADHPWLSILVRSAKAAHPRGLDAGAEKMRDTIEDAYGKKYAGQPDWLRGVYQVFERR